MNPSASRSPWPADKGRSCRLRFIESFAEIDVLAALSVCPHGDMSKPVWGPGAGDGLDICRPLAIEVWQPAPSLLAGWKSPAPSDYRGGHGLREP